MIHTPAITMRQSDAFLADAYTTHPDIHMNIVTFHILFSPTGVSHIEKKSKVITYWMTKTSPVTVKPLIHLAVI